MRLGAQPAVAYVRLPLLRLTAPLDAIAVPGSAYLALRQGSYNVAQQGDAGLSDAAETLAKPLGTSGLRVAAAVPQGNSGTLGPGAVGCAIVAALLLIIAVLLVLASRGRWPCHAVGLPANPAPMNPPSVRACSRTPALPAKRARWTSTPRPQCRRCWCRRCRSPPRCSAPTTSVVWSAKTSTPALPP
ncbi:hypothetical protein FDU21_16100 [Xanthomonas oryzae pv. oryzae]|nr:hypothetical protein FDU21_16100 [Xanthomonas oryzae pv. oryzae]